MLVDVHCHLTSKEINSLEIINRAKKAGVKIIITNGLDYEDNKKVLELSKKFDIVKPALGLYPLNAIGLQQDGSRNKINIKKVLRQIEINNPISIGEVGLDGKYGKEYLAEQVKVFLKIIKIAEKINKPLSVHSRNAEKEVIDLLENTKAKVLMHCFGGSKKLVKKCINLGFYFSIPTIITKSSHFKMIAELCPLNKLLTETDSPWLSPYKDKLNEPAFVIESIKKIADIKKITIEECKNEIFKNYKNLFEKKCAK